MSDAPTDAPAKPTAPLHQYETRYCRDSEGRRIEFRQLLPGSTDPGPEHFSEFLGTVTVNLVVAGVSNPLPVQFNIPGVRDVMGAFKVFDGLAQKAAEQAKARMESSLMRAQLAAGGRAGAAAGLGVPGRNGEPRRLIELG